jgi:hypothetical protein
LHAAAQPSVSDGTFPEADWSLTQFTAGGGGSSTAQQVLTFGNPDAYRLVINDLNAAPPGSRSVVLSANIYAPFTYDPSVSGAIASLDYSEDTACRGGCNGQEQFTGPAVLQGGKVYILSTSTVLTGNGPNWATRPLNGLTAADFGLVKVTPTTLFDNTRHPNFSARGAPIQFGFFRANGSSSAGYELQTGIDNWRITLTVAPPRAGAPALDAFALAVLAGLLALLGTSGLRRTR